MVSNNTEEYDFPKKKEVDTVYKRKTSSCNSTVVVENSVDNDSMTDFNHNKTSSNSSEGDAKHVASSEEQSARCCFNKQKKRSSITSWALRNELSQTKVKNISILSLSSLSPSPRSAGDDSAFFSTNHADEIYLTIGLCRDYVCHRLKRSGFSWKVYITEYAPAKDQVLSSRISTIGHIFENSYPHIYKNLSRKLGYVFESEPTIRRLYYRLATHVVGFDSKDFTWSRILSLFSLAGAMAVDCVSQGHPELVEELVKISSDYMKQYILEWVMHQGGWKAMKNHFKQKRTNSNFQLFEFVTESKYAVTTLGLVGISLISTFVIQLFI